MLVTRINSTETNWYNGKQKTKRLVFRQSNPKLIAALERIVTPSPKLAEVAPSALVARFEMYDGSIKTLYQLYPRKVGVDLYINLAEDGTAHFRLPDFALVKDQAKWSRIIEGDGTWSVIDTEVDDKGNTAQKLRLMTDTAEGGETQFIFGEQSGVDFIGFPVTFEVGLFTKETTNANFWFRNSAQLSPFAR